MEKKAQADVENEKKKCTALEEELVSERKKYLELEISYTEVRACRSYLFCLFFLIMFFFLQVCEHKDGLVQAKAYYTREHSRQLSVIQDLETKEDGYKKVIEVFFLFIYTLYFLYIILFPGFAKRTTANRPR